uniref:DNA replication licensing factor MCM2 n=1 Tax=Prasinoderma singulare TaxID=676789 RepID=A0A7S3F779_9VIRI
MARRDAAEGRGVVGGTRLPALLADDGDDDEDLERPRRRRRIEGPAGSDGLEEEGEDEQVKLDAVEGRLNEYIARPRTRREIRRRFRHFLEHFHEDRGRTYGHIIESMCSRNSQSLEVNYVHLSQEEPLLAIWVADAPQPMLEIFNEVAQDVVLEKFPDYGRIAPEIFVRITGLPILDSIRDIRQAHLNALIKIAGVVTRRTGVFPQLQSAYYDCQTCGYLVGPVHQTGVVEDKPQMCPACQGRTFEINIDKTKYRNYQKVTLQESPGTVPAGRLPRSKEVVLQDDLMDQARPGEEVEITGIYTNSFDRALNTKNGFPVFSTIVEANYLSKREDAYAVYRLSDTDKEEVLKLSRDERIAKRIVRSIAPSIYGHKHIKTSLALSMFGGQEKNPAGKHRLRGDINVLLLGDPSTAKSQFLKFVEKTAPISVYTSGKGSSAAGLTASVIRDQNNEFYLEGGAMVLADGGVVCIDEFDKMRPEDRVAIHEAMEQQTISIAKAGINATLNARTSILAAANPTDGRYDRSKPLKYNVALPPAIMSRFDLIHVMIDEPNEVHDYNVARHIVAVHKDGADATELDASYNTAQMQRFVKYARSIVPRITKEARAELVRSYTRLRTADAAPGSGSAYRMTVRQLEAMVRLSEALARATLCEEVKQWHVQEARRLLRTSIIALETEDVVLDEDIDMDEALGGAGGALLADDGEQGADAGEGGSQVKQERRQVTISYERFSRVSRALLLRLLEADEDGEESVQQLSLVADYVRTQLKKGAIDEAGVEDEATLARSVVQHMVVKEGAMLVIADEGEQEADEDDVELVGEHAFDKRMLSANPAYEQD